MTKRVPEYITSCHNKVAKIAFGILQILEFQIILLIFWKFQCRSLSKISGVNPLTGQWEGRYESSIVILLARNLYSVRWCMNWAFTKGRKIKTRFLSSSAILYPFNIWWRLAHDKVEGDMWRYLIGFVCHSLIFSYSSFSFLSFTVEVGWGYDSPSSSYKSYRSFSKKRKRKKKKKTLSDDLDCRLRTISSIRLSYCSELLLSNLSPQNFDCISIHFLILLETQIEFLLSRSIAKQTHQLPL